MASPPNKVKALTRGQGKRPATSWVAGRRETKSAAKPKMFNSGMHYLALLLILIFS
jgi:hypothetical protein